MYICLNICIHMYTYIFIHVHRYICTCLYTYIDTYVYLCIHMYMYIYLYIYISIYIYIYIMHKIYTSPPFHPPSSVAAPPTPYCWYCIVLQCVAAAVATASHPLFPTAAAPTTRAVPLDSVSVLCCSALQRVAAYCSALPRGAVCYSALQRVAVCCSALQSVAVCCNTSCAAPLRSVAAIAHHLSCVSETHHVSHTA